MSSNISTSSAKNNHRPKNNSRSTIGIVENNVKTKENFREVETEGNFNLITKKLQIVLGKHQGERQIVVIQDFPDPDALSSAWAYKLIAEKYNIDCDIVYGGILSHQENIALVKLTNLPSKRISAESLKQERH